MTTWTDETTIETGWASESNINTAVSILYNAPVAYDADYITYNGYYVRDETDWNTESSIETAWADA